MNSGQVCSRPDPDPGASRPHDEFVDALAAEMSSLGVGDPTDPATEVGPLVAQRQQDRVRGYIDDRPAEGARLVVGGSGMPDGLDRGWYVRPTLFADADNTMRIAREEIFGPVLTVIPYSDEEEPWRLPTTPTTAWRDRCGPPTPTGAWRSPSRIRTGTFGVNQGYSMDPGSPRSAG